MRGGDWTEDKSRSIEISSGTEARRCRQEERKMAKKKKGQKKSIFMSIQQAESGTVLCAQKRTCLDSWRRPRGTLRCTAEVREVCHSEQLRHIQKRRGDQRLACSKKIIEKTRPSFSVLVFICFFLVDVATYKVHHQLIELLIIRIAILQGCAFDPFYGNADIGGRNLPLPVGAAKRPKRINRRKCSKCFQLHLSKSRRGS